MILITDIADAVKAGNSDADLLLIIQGFIGEGQDAVAWTKVNYSDLRRWAYPDLSEYIDAQVKIASGDADLEVAGRDQLADYNAKCLSVKSRFPKSNV